MVNIVIIHGNYNKENSAVFLKKQENCKMFIIKMNEVIKRYRPIYLTTAPKGGGFLNIY